MSIPRFTLRSGLATVGVAAVLGFAPTALARTHVMVCEMRGGQAVPPVATPARGCGRFVIDTTANTISYHIVYTALAGTETVAHLHGNAGPGANAGVKISLPAGSPKVGTATYVEADEAALLGGQWYVNIHSTVAPGGEIRGQIADMVADINGFQENPDTGSSGSAWGVFNVDRCANTIDYHIVIEGLDGTESAAHIHGFALHGTNAGVQHNLGTGALKTGTWTYNESDEARILDGQTYVNIHSDIDPGGEIRGQITGHVSPIDGQQEVPPTGSTTYGCGMFSLDRASDQLGYFIVHDGLASGETVAHIHGFAPAGANAGVQHGLTVGMNKKGVWNYAAGDEASILDELTYVNIHSNANPGGEIRGQVRFLAPPCLSDVNCDDDTNISDLLALLAAWGPCPSPPAPCATDLNGDGMTDVVDLLAMLAGWGPCP